MTPYEAFKRHHPFTPTLPIENALFWSIIFAEPDFSKPFRVVTFRNLAQNDTNPSPVGREP